MQLRMAKTSLCNPKSQVKHCSHDCKVFDVTSNFPTYQVVAILWPSILLVEHF